MRRNNFLLLLMLIFGTTVGYGASTPENVSLQLQWRHQFQFAGFYVAKERGFYKKAGLNVEIREFRPDIRVVDEVLTRKATYGTGRSSLIIDKSRGEEVVVLSAIFEHSPSVLVTTKSGLIRPSDLKNRRVMITDDESMSVSISAMLTSEGVGPGKYVHQQHTSRLEDLIDGKTDAMACYISNEPYVLGEKGIDYNIINPRSYGFDFYGDLLFTSEQELKEHPERARAFVKATILGWQEAFKDIPAAARLIHKRYNTQNKTLASLIYEGESLSSLYCTQEGCIPTLDFRRFEQMADIYRVSGMLHGQPDLDALLDPLSLNRKEIRIGVLAKRGKEKTTEAWRCLGTYLNHALPEYHSLIVPLGFDEVDRAVERKSIDFVITNSMHYVRLEDRYGISRIATLINQSSQGPVDRFGAVIFTRSDSRKISTLKDLPGKRFGAVHPDSFGGWIMALKELKDQGVDPEDFRSTAFLKTHDNVVYAVLERRVDAGVVRTDTLERMAGEGKIDLEKVKVLGRKKRKAFPYLLSTELYPEWPFAKLPHTSAKVSNRVLGQLLQNDESELSRLGCHIAGWSIPLNYRSVHGLLRSLRLDPYLPQAITFGEIFRRYYPSFIFVGTLFIVMLIFLAKINRLNRALARSNKQTMQFNMQLEQKVEERTKQLREVNEKLRELADTDYLTGIANRRYFYALATKYFNIARRNDTGLVVMMLDIDHFKKINDLYGHAAGDKVLRQLTVAVRVILRRSDLFGRVGGEEFCICLQNTGIDQAYIFAQKVRRTVETIRYALEETEKVKVTVSIGLSAIKAQDGELEDLIKRADQALYIAKDRGRNRIEKL